MSYWDTSTLVKLYAKEPDSVVFVNYLRHGGIPQFTSEIAIYEALATFHRKEASGTLLSGGAERSFRELKNDIGRGVLRTIKLEEELLKEYSKIPIFCHLQTPAIPLRTLDAIHLASAIISRQTEIVTTDARMREAANKLGCTLFPT